MISSEVCTNTNMQVTHRSYRSFLDEISICGFAVYNILGTLINSYYSRIDSIRLLINCLRIAIFFIFALDVLDKLLQRKIKLSLSFYVFSLVSLLIFFISRHYNLIFMMIFATWVGCFEFKEILKIGIRFRFIGIFIVVISAFFGIIQNDLVERIGSEALRYSLGFIAPSLCLAYILNILIAEIIVSNFNLKWWKIICYTALVVLIYYVTNARLDALICLFILTCAVLAKILKRISNIIFKYRFLRILCLSTPLIAFLLNILLLYGFKSNISVFVNIASLLSRRVEYTLEAYNLVGIKLFGSDIVWQKYDIILDSSYFKILLEFGVVALALILFGYCVIIKKTLRNKNFTVLFSIILILIESIFEPFLFDYNYNFLIFLFGLIFVKNLNLKGEKSGIKKGSGNHCNT